MERLDEKVEAGIDVVRHTEATTFFQRNKAVKAGTKYTCRVNEVVASQAVTLQDGKYRLEDRLRERLAFLVYRCGGRERGGIAPGVRPRVGPVRRRRGPKRVRAGPPDGRRLELSAELAERQRADFPAEPLEDHPPRLHGDDPRPHGYEPAPELGHHADRE